MNRNPALMELAPGKLLWVSERQLGVFFCGETFAFVLRPRTRAAAERVARFTAAVSGSIPPTGGPHSSNWIVHRVFCWLR